MMNSRGTVGSRPRSTRSSISAWTPPPEPVLLDRLLPARQRKLVAREVAHPRPLDRNLAAVEADLASGAAPAVTAPPLAAGVARPASILRVFHHHGAQRLDPGSQAE